VVDLSGIKELKGVRTTRDGIEIGAMTTLTEVVKNPIIRQKYRLLAQAAELVASPQIGTRARSAATCRRTRGAGITGNGWPCYRAGGNICYADTPEAATASTRFSTRTAAWR